MAYRPLPRRLERRLGLVEAIGHVAARAVRALAEHAAVYRKRALFPWDRRIDQSRNMPARAKTTPAIA